CRCPRCRPPPGTGWSAAVAAAPRSAPRGRRTGGARRCETGGGRGTGWDGRGCSSRRLLRSADGRDKVCQQSRVKGMVGLSDHLRRNAFEAFLAVVGGGRHVDRADGDGPRVAVAGRFLQVANLEVHPVHAGGPVEDQRRVAIAQVLDVNLLDFRFFGLESRQADLDPLGIEEIFEGLEGGFILLIANQVHPRGGTGWRLGGWLVALGLLALPASPQ